MPETLTGGCLCGAVRWAIDGEVRLMGMCHCSRCRRWTGARCSQELAVLREQARWTRGADVLRVAEIPGIGRRTFCPRCGSSLIFGSLDQVERPILGVLAGTLDPELDPGVRPVAHGFAGSKAPWDAIADGLPAIRDEDLGDWVSPEEAAALEAAPLPEPPSAARPVEGGCLCGAVRYAVTGPFVRANHCHCTRCRRHSGSYGLTQGRVRPEHFALLRGADVLTSYAEPGHAAKVFCGACGSSMFGGEWPGGRTVSIRLGSLDGDPGIRPQFHTFVGEKAVWDAITDDLRQFPTGPERGAP